MSEIIAEKYEVIETIGRGGMGTVYKARQTNLDRIVAIKMLSEELAADPEFRARFHQEATVVARLNHPNIVQIFDIEPHNNTFCIIMEYVDGENLQAKIDRDVTLAEQEVVVIGAQVSRALAYAHTKGIVHRDIKPDNIHVTPKGVAKVMDFGIARIHDSKLKTQTGISMGTPKFMSPEQVTGKNVDGQTDLYSLGICMYYCLAGKPPFDGENAISVATRHLYEQPEPPSHLNASISPAVEKVILKALEKQKPKRYLTGIEMAEALEGVLKIRGTGGPDDDQIAGNKGDVTQKMAVQSLTPDGQGAGTVQDGPDVTPSRASASRQVPELASDFHTPRGDVASQDPTRSFQRSLVIFAGMVFAAVLLLILLVIWLRRPDPYLDSENPDRTDITVAERFDRVRLEANELVKHGRIVDARNAWVRFQTNYPDADTSEVITQLFLLESQFPESEVKVLGDRRRNLANMHLTRRELAVAGAYFHAAVALAPDLMTTDIDQQTSGLLQRSKLSVEPSTTEVESAKQYFALAEKRIANNLWDDELRRLLIMAVESDYRVGSYWEALGNYFLQQGDKDSARVMYDEAIARYGDSVQKQELAARRNALRD